MLGFNPIAATPIGATSSDTVVFATSQTATLTQHSISLSAAATASASSQNLVITPNSLTVQAAANYALNSQNLATTLHSVSLVTENTVTLESQSIISTIHGSNSIGGDNCSIAALPLCSIPYPDPALEFTGVQIDAYPAITGQTLTLSQTSVVISDDDTITVSPQVITTTLNSLSVSVDAGVPDLGSQSLALTLNSIVVAVQPPTFEAQTIASALNSVELVTDVVLTVDSQTIGLTLNSVAIGLGYTILVDSQALALTQNSVEFSTDVNAVLTAQRLTTAVNFVSLVTDQNLSVASQTIYTELNGLRFWRDIDTAQTASCSGAIPGTWNEIVFGDLFYGDNFAIAATPIGTVPQENPPIRVNPPQTWDQISTATTTTWTNVET